MAKSFQNVGPAVAKLRGPIVTVFVPFKYFIRSFIPSVYICICGNIEEFNKIKIKIKMLLLEQHDNDKRGLTVLPWANEHCLLWDSTCPDISSRQNRAELGSEIVANDAESRKSTNFSSLSALYRFIPIAIETLGVPGDEALSFFQDLRQRIAVATAEPRSFQFLMQRLSVAIQRDNAACIIGTVPSSAGWDEHLHFNS